jgi:HemY protein
MRLFLWLVALMAAAIGIAVTARFNPGNVVLFYPPHRIDLSLNFFVVLEVALFALYVLIRAFRATVKMPGKVAATASASASAMATKGCAKRSKPCSKAVSAMPRKPRCVPPNCRKTPAWPR